MDNANEAPEVTPHLLFLIKWGPCLDGVLVLTDLIHPVGVSAVPLLVCEDLGPGVVIVHAVGVVVHRRVIRVHLH